MVAVYSLTEITTSHLTIVDAAKRAWKRRGVLEATQNRRRSQCWTVLPS